MSPFLIKSITALLFIIAGLFTLLTMFTLMGKSEKKMSPDKLRKLHRSMGWIFFLLFLVNGYYGVRFIAQMGDQMPLRAVFHVVFAIGLFSLLMIKVLIVRGYKQFLKFAPAMGIAIFILAFVLTGISGGFYLIRSLSAPPDTLPASSDSPSTIIPDSERGASLYPAKCGSCHYADREETNLGPGLKNLLKKTALPYSGRPATLDNVKQQLIRPARSMPSFAGLSEKDMADILAYLQTL